LPTREIKSRKDFQRVKIQTSTAIQKEFEPPAPQTHEILTGVHKIKNIEKAMKDINSNIQQPEVV
jgi:hypothetical protein